MSELIELRSASGELRVRLERESGSLVGLSSAALSWEALGAGRGARPFELLLPRPDNRANRTARRPPTPPRAHRRGGRHRGRAALAPGGLRGGRGT